MHYWGEFLEVSLSWAKAMHGTVVGTLWCALLLAVHLHQPEAGHQREEAAETAGAP